MDGRTRLKMFLIGVIFVGVLAMENVTASAHGRLYYLPHRPYRHGSDAITTFGLLPPGSAIEHPVADTWERVGGRFLKYHGTAATWHEALSICLLEESTLVIDDDPDIHVHLQNKANGEENIWIGATDLGHEGQWVWVNGARVGHGHDTYWARGQPDNGGGRENCAHIWGTQGNDWNDSRCDNKMTFFCQILRKGI